MFLVTLRSADYFIQYLYVIGFSLIAYERIESFLNYEIEKLGETYIDEKRAIPVRIELKNISYGYTKSNLILKDVNLVVKENKIVSIIGKNGSGKTTLLRILSGLVEPSKGSYKINRKRDLGYIRSISSYISQECELFDGTIYENIACSKENKHLQKVKKSAKMAGIYEEIISFPKGFETKVGERGKFLSLGQRQRVAIARGIFKDTDIFFLTNQPHL